jgi:hypothetical protein
VKLYRVFPHDAGVAATNRGGALFIPEPSGLGRIDNSDLYSVLYVASTPHAAIAESFGRLAVWRPSTFIHRSGLPYAIATYEAPDDLSIFDLDEIDALRSIGIRRPTDVITRDRAKTQAWARTIFAMGRFHGARWWSYYDPDWPVIGLWDSSPLTLAAVEVLTSTDVLVQETAISIVRQITR